MHKNILLNNFKEVFYKLKLMEHKNIDKKLIFMDKY
jgi:hypothetical protein